MSAVFCKKVEVLANLALKQLGDKPCYPFAVGTLIGVMQNLSFRLTEAELKKVEAVLDLHIKGMEKK
jgi:hypothetical protein